MLILLLITTALFALPLAPTAGLFLWRRHALGPPQLSEGAYTPDHFARTLIGKLRSHLPILDGARPLIQEHRLDGEPLLVVPSTVHRIGSDCIKTMTYALGDITLPASLSFKKEVAAEGSLRSGENGRYRVLYSADILHLAKNSTIIRWCHAGRQLVIDGGAQILGRATANVRMIVAAPCMFTSLTAPEIVIGDGGEALPAEAGAGALEVWVEEERVVQGDLALPANSRHRGSLKAHGRLLIGADSIVTGGLVCDGDISIGPRCRIWGPVVADGAIEIAGGCVIGRPGRPASVAGASVSVVTPGLVYGAVHASHSGIISNT